MVMGFTKELHVHVYTVDKDISDVVIAKLLSQNEKIFPNGLDSTSVTNIFKNTTTLLSLRNMFRCFKHHLQP